MSLVNDMLRDLDSRQAAGQARPLAAPAPTRESRPIRLVSVVVFLMLTSAGGLWWMTAGRAPAAEAPEVGEAPAVTEELSREVVPELPPVADLPGEPEAAPTPPVEMAAAAENGAVERLLAAAEEAYADDRLTQPPVHNAHALYSHALLLQPESAEAQAGIGRIQSRYLELAHVALDKGDTEQASRYLSRARRTGVADRELESLHEALARLQEKASADMDVAKPADDQPKAQPQSSRMSLSWRSKQEAAMAEAGSRLQKNDSAGAIASLQALLAEAPQAEAAALMLFDLYLDNGRLEQARALQKLASSPELNHYYAAKLLVRGGESLQALELLEQVEPRGALEEPYTALQAALYQREKRYAEAFRFYGYLVDLNRREPNYWLGLAVAAEALRDRSRALQAFTVADQLAPANPAVSDYIKQRIAALSSQ